MAYEKSRKEPPANPRHLISLEIIREPDGEPVVVRHLLSLKHYVGDDGRVRYLIETYDTEAAERLSPGSIGRVFVRHQKAGDEFEVDLVAVAANPSDGEAGGHNTAKDEGYRAFVVDDPGGGDWGFGVLPNLDIGFWQVEGRPLVAGGSREFARLAIRLVEPGKPKAEKRRGILGFLWR